MKYMKKALFSIALLASSTVAADQWGTSFFLGANVGNIAGSGLIEAAGRTHRFDADGFYGVFSTHSEYNKSFKASDLGKFFSPINNNTFRVGPENTAAANAATDVMNAFLLIEENAVIDVTLKPESKTFSTNLGLFVGLDEFYEGLWFDVNLPIVHNKRHVKISETQVTAATDTTFPNDYFAAGATATVPYTTFTGAMKGDLTTSVGVESNNLKYGKIDGSRSHTKVGNVTLALGYDFMNKENCHLGLGVSALINGNGKSDAVYMFEPSVGTGGRHGIGARLDGHYRVYEKDDCDVSLYLKANVHHLFDSTVLRTYDFTTKHGKWSRYILFKQGDASTWTAIVANGITHGVNFSTLNAKVGISAMYDVNLMAAYSNGALGINVGYGLFGHSKEKHKSWVDSFTTKFYGAWSPDDADICAAHDIEAASTDIKIDGGNGSSAAVTVVAQNAAGTVNNMKLTDIDTNSGLQPSAMVHRVYGDVNYKWEDNEWEPHLGLGGGAEFASNNKALAQWGVHFHGGICF